MRMSIKGKTILITRPTEKSDKFVHEIERRQGMAVVAPMIRIIEPESWTECDRALTRCGVYNSLVFTSTSAVTSFFQRATIQGIHPSNFTHCTIYTVGDGTRRAVEDLGLLVHFSPERFSANDLAGYFNTENVSGRKFLLPQGDIALGTVQHVLERRGAEVDVVVVYRTVGPNEDDAQCVRRKLLAGEIDIATFASPSAISNFSHVVTAEAFRKLPRTVHIAVIGPTTEQEAIHLGYPVTIVAHPHTVHGLLESIEHYY